MEAYIRKLTIADLPIVEQLSADKLEATNTDDRIFQDPYSKPLYKHFILPDTVYNSNLLGCYGYYINDTLQGVLGYRCIRNEPAWLLSFIVTSKDCESSMQVIKELMTSTLKEMENHGYFQWYVVSKLDKFRAWQKLFKSARLDYHHYVYARTKANELPKWNSALGLSGNKLFPYDTNISMYVSKKLCTVDDDGDTASIDDTLL